MNEQLHHKWNSERNPNRGSSDEGRQVLEKEVNLNKVTLKQNKPR
jgi:hypothetical protein